jgi:hypothetical protein
MKQLVFLIISYTPSLKTIAQISSHSFWLNRLICIVFPYIYLILPNSSTKIQHVKAQWVALLIIEDDGWISKQSLKFLNTRPKVAVRLLDGTFPSKFSPK